ncbi:3-oxoacyl-ACP synthase III [Elusimicrobiota bacterium]
MKFKNVCIESIAHFLPEESVTSEAIEKRLSSVYDRLNLSIGRLELMTGIKERRFWEHGTSPSLASSMVGKIAIEESGIDKEKIGCLIHSAVCRDFLEPATASVVHEKLKLNEDVMLFDLSNACLGFLNAMVIVGNMIENGVIKAGLIVAGETGRPLVDTTIENMLNDKALTRKSIKSSLASLTIGSGAAAALLVHSSISRKKHYLLGGEIIASTGFNNLCKGGALARSDSASKPLMNTDAETLLNAGCELAKRTWKKVKMSLDISEQKVDHYFCHQVGSAHRKLLFDTLELDITKEYSTFGYLGNVGSVSLPATFSIGIEKRSLKKDDLVILMGIGSGINCMILAVKW